MYQGHGLALLGSTDCLTAILLAGGAGDRFGGGTPKQFAHLAGEPLLVHPLRVLVSSLAVEAIVVVLPAVRDPSIDEACRLPKVSSVTRGGGSRRESLSRGLKAVPPQTDLVLVHDAARPLLQEPLIDAVVAGLRDTYDGAVCGLPMEDSMKQANEDGLVAGTVQREGVWRVQTPQVFRRPALEDGLARSESEGIEVTDCSEMLTRAGYPVKLIEGDPFNVKVTRPEDLLLAQLIYEARTGGRDGEEEDW